MKERAATKERVADVLTRPHNAADAEAESTVTAQLSSYGQHLLGPYLRQAGFLQNGNYPFPKLSPEPQPTEELAA